MLKKTCFSKGPRKRKHIVIGTLLSTEMFPRLPACATFVADTNNVSNFVQKHFVSVTNVSKFALPKKHPGQQCVFGYQGLNINISFAPVAKQRAKGSSFGCGAWPPLIPSLQTGFPYGLFRAS